VSLPKDNKDSIAEPVKGLEGIVAADTKLSSVNGEKGILRYCGYNIDDLAFDTTFEETICLLYDTELPNKDRLSEMTKRIGEARVLPKEVIKVITELSGKTSPMSTLRTVVSSLGHFEKNVPLNDLPPKALRLVGQISTAVAIIHRLREGLPLIEADPTRGHAEDFLRMLHGKEPTEIQIKALNLYLILLADHGFNASTFSARVTAGTLANMHSAITSAVGTLSGPLHGGANEKAMEMIIEVGNVENASAFVENALNTKQKIMGFGHRVYKVDDARRSHLKGMAKKIWEERGDMALFNVSEEIEKQVKSKKDIITNVDFYSAPLLYGLDIPTDLFTPLFAMSRVAGWTAHVLEQYKNNRLIRPRARYVGTIDRTFRPIEQR
jgi:citrate synthase|tara:strand:+ start:4263 stop:5405 length:1143 start_codon:yes stop_codon:yes gene_type:complete